MLLHNFIPPAFHLKYYLKHVYFWHPEHRHHETMHPTNPPVSPKHGTWWEPPSFPSPSSPRCDLLSHCSCIPNDTCAPPQDRHPSFCMLGFSLKQTTFYCLHFSATVIIHSILLLFILTDTHFVQNRVIYFSILHWCTLSCFYYFALTSNTARNGLEPTDASMWGFWLTGFVHFHLYGNCQIRA